LEISYPLIKKAPIEASLTKLKDAHKAQDITQIDAAMAEINAAWTAASEEMYKASQYNTGAQPNAGQQAGAEQTSQGNEGAGTENVTDAEFEEVK
jgi:molecular chaperone DnaK